jgi:cytochrome c-type biogenesis protein
MDEIANIGLISAFLAGMISFLSPCVLPLVPGYVSYVAGRCTPSAAA